MLKTMMANAKDNDEAKRLRKLLDQELNVNEWRVPGTTRTRRRKEIDTAPSWWRGDEDASQTFLHAMGIVVRDRGKP